MPTVFIDGPYRFYFFNMHKLDTEVTNISPHGIWVLSNDREYFIDYKYFPFFKDATIKEIANIQVDNFGNFHWPDLDIDIEIDSIDKPENFPLVYQE